MGTPGKARVRRVVRAAAAIIVALACALIGAVTAHATDRVLTADAIDLNQQNEGINLEYTVSVSRPTDRYLTDGTVIYGEYEQIQPNDDGSYTLSPQEYGNGAVEPRYQFKADFTIAQGALNGHDTLEFLLPDGLDLVGGTVVDEPIRDASGREMGRYTITGGVCRLVFNSDVVEGNAQHVLTGDFTLRVQMNEDSLHSGLEWPLPGSRVIVSFGKKYDLHVSKSSRWENNPQAVANAFTINVTSQYGTAGPITLADVLKTKNDKGELVDTQVGEVENVVITKNGKATDLQCAALNCELPKLNAGESYEISYRTVFTDEEKGKQFVNTVGVSSDDGNGGKLEDNAQVEFWTPNPSDPEPDTKPWLVKEFVRKFELEDADGTATPMLAWKLTINANHVDLGDWTVSDIPGENVGQPQNICARVQGREDLACVFTELPHTFAAGDTNAYEVTYNTSYDDSVLVTGYKNSAKMEHGNESVWSDGWYDLWNSNPIAKQGTGMSADGEVPTADGSGKTTGRTLKWRLAVNETNSRDLPAGWEFRDELQSNSWPVEYAQFFSAEQQQVIAKHIKQVFAAAGLDEPTVTFSGNGDGDAVMRRFTVSSPSPLPKDKLLVFEFESTVTGDFSNLSTEFDIANKAYLGNYSAEGKLHVKPGEVPTEFAKTDSTDSSSITNVDGLGSVHELGKLPTNKWRPYLEWKIELKPGTELFKAIEQGGDLTITEHLPDGMELMPALQQNCQMNADADEKCLSGLQVSDVHGASDWGATGQLVADGGNSGQYVLSGAQYSHFEGTALALASGHSGKVQIVLKEALLKAILPQKDADGNFEMDLNNRKCITLTVRAQWMNWNPQLPDGYRVHQSFTNTVEWSKSGADGGGASNTQIVYDAQGEASKEFIGQKEGTGGLVPYQLDINSKALCLGGASAQRSGDCETSTYTFEDVASVNHIIGYGEAVLVLEPTSVAVYEEVGENAPGAQQKQLVDCGTDSAGKVWCKPVDYKTIWVRQLSADEYKYVLTSDHPETEVKINSDGKEEDSAIWSEKLTFTVPNGKRIIIDYSYRLTGVFGSDANGEIKPWLEVSNIATVDGYVAKPTDQEVKIHMESGDAHVDGIHVSLFKADASNSAKLLGGATFELLEWNADSEEFQSTGVKVITSQEDVKDSSDKVIVHKGEALIGKTQYENFAVNRAYALKEIVAPVGYELSDELTYFMAKQTGAAAPAIVAPVGFGTSGKYASANVFDSTMQPTLWVYDAPSVILPSAGGSGSARIFVLGGLALLAVVLACAVVMLKRPEISGR